MDDSNSVDQASETTYMPLQDTKTRTASEPLQHDEIEILLKDCKGGDNEVAVQEIVLNDKDADNMITKIASFVENEVVVQEILLDDKNSDNIVTKIASFAEKTEVVMQEIVLDDKDSDNIVTKIASVAEKTSPKAGEVYNEIDVSELNQNMSELPDEEFSKLLETMGVDLDEFMTNLNAITVEEERQVIEEASSENSLGVDAGDEDSQSTPSAVVLSSVSEDFEGSASINENLEGINSCSLSPPQEITCECQDTQNVNECNDMIHGQGGSDEDTTQNKSFSNYIRSLLKLMHKFDNIMIELTENAIHSLFPKVDMAALCTMRKRNANIRLTSALVVKGTKTIYILYVLQNAIHPLRGIAPFLVVLTLLVNFQRHYSANLKKNK